MYHLKSASSMNSTRLFTVLATAMLLFAICAIPIAAQSTAGRFSGTVTDPSGAGVPKAAVTALNSETGQKITEATNAEGRFVLYPLPPGTYDVTVQKEGFNSFTI